MSQSILEFLSRTLLFTRTAQPEEKVQLLLSTCSQRETEEHFSKELLLTEILLAADSSHALAGEAFERFSARRITTGAELFAYRTALLQHVISPQPYRYPPEYAIYQDELSIPGFLKELQEAFPDAKIAGIAQRESPLTLGELLYRMYFGFRYRGNASILGKSKLLASKDVRGVKFFLREEQTAIAAYLSDPNNQAGRETSRRYEEFLKEHYADFFDA